MQLVDGSLHGQAGWNTILADWTKSCACEVQILAAACTRTLPQGFGISSRARHCGFTLVIVQFLHHEVKYSLVHSRVAESFASVRCARDDHEVCVTL
eukprot:6196297-Pleurochrysis_carterae.AAC.4